MSKKNFSDSIRGKGYYIALILCAVAIGISGYLYYRNTNDTELQLQNQPNADVQVNASLDNDTQPTQTDGEQSNPTEATSAMKAIETAFPVEGDTIAEYAMDCLSYNQTTRDWRTHNGVDIAAEAGASVCAAAAGTVYTVYEDEMMGTVVVIRHDGGYATEYASLDEQVKVAAGDSVKMGQAIGCVGQSALLESAIGDHVHFSVTCNGESVNPAEFLPQQ